MTFSGIITAIGSVAAIISGFVWLIKQLRGTAEEAAQEVDKKVSDEKKAVESGGRPKW